MDDNNYPTNACFDNSSFTSTNSLTHFLDKDTNDIISVSRAYIILFLFNNMSCFQNKDIH